MKGGELLKRLRKIYFMFQIALLAIECAREIKKLFKKKKEKEKEPEDDSDGTDRESTEE